MLLVVQNWRRKKCSVMGFGFSIFSKDRQTIFRGVCTQPAFTCSKSTMETPEQCEICSKLTIKTPGRSQ